MLYVIYNNYIQSGKITVMTLPTNPINPRFVRTTYDLIFSPNKMLLQHFSHCWSA